jgi:hypothetical protein
LPCSFLSQPDGLFKIAHENDLIEFLLWWINMVTRELKICIPMYAGVLWFRLLGELGYLP